MWSPGGRRHQRQPIGYANDRDEALDRCPRDEGDRRAVVAT
jgi:hypothetical protein